MKIYTRLGDRGETSLLGGGRVPKDDARVDAYGEIDEANSTLGVAISALEHEGLLDLAAQLRSLQEDLFAIGARLAAPDSVEGGPASRHLPPLPIARVAEMERWIDEADARLAPLRTFILPGGTQAAAALHLARTVCRRAERRVLSLAAGGAVEGDVIVYLNRLSDLLFTYARLANREHGADDIPWTGRR